MWKIVWRVDCAFFDGKNMGSLKGGKVNHLFKVNLSGLTNLLMARF